MADRRGQGIPLDFVAGLFIFMVLLAYFIILWDMFATRYVEFGQDLSLESDAISLANRLAVSQGSPYNWSAEPSAASSVGLASRPNVIDPGKVAALQSLSYAEAKDALSVDFDFLLKLESLNGTRLETIGNESGMGGKAVEVSRAVVYRGNAARLLVRAYG